jgi:prefoldin subunit 5
MIIFFAILTSAIKKLSNKVNTLENKNKKLNSLILELSNNVKKIIFSLNF